MFGKWDILNAPLIPSFERLLQNVSQQKKRTFYQILAFTLTFITYALYHLNKRPFSIVKDLSPKNCNSTKKTCHFWQPYSNHNKGKGKNLFSLLDFTFMISYSLALFVSGHVVKNCNLRLFLTFGMLVTGAATSLVGLAKYLHIHMILYYVVTQVLGGITQSTGYPCVTEVIGMWFPDGRRGITYGIWSLHAIIGNIAGSLMAGHFTNIDWSLSFIIPSIIICCFAGIVLLVLIPDPAIVNIYVNDDAPDVVSSVNNSLQPLLEEDEEENIDEDNEDESVGITFWNAWSIPGVASYALCSVFVKLVLYTFFFWLGYFIHTTKLEGKSIDRQHSSYYSVIFDIGGALGGILSGIVFDYTDAPAIICVILLVVAAPCIYMFIIHLTTITCFMLFMFLTGFCVRAPFVIITTMVAAKLGSRELVQRNNKGIAMLNAIFDGCGSVGAGVGPLMTGIVARGNSWDNVGYMMIICVLLAAVILSKESYNEVIFIRAKRAILQDSDNTENGNKEYIQSNDQFFENNDNNNKEYTQSNAE